MAIVPSLVAFGALETWPGAQWQLHLKARLRELRDFKPIVAAVLELPSLWDALCSEDNELRSGSGKAAADDLVRWMIEDSRESPSQHHCNAMTMPMTIISHIVQYFAFLDQKTSSIDHAALLNQVANRGGIQGFCAGILSALAVASGKTQAEVAVFAATSIRLAFCVGAYIDRDEECSVQHSTFALRWPRTVSRSTIDRIVANHPEAYIAGLRDERDATVTCQAPAFQNLCDDLTTSGCSIRQTGLPGRYHCPAHQNGPERIWNACRERVQPSFSNVSLVRCNSDGSKLRNEGVVLQVLRGILQERADWHSTMCLAAADSDKSGFILGIGLDAIPHSVAKRTFTRKVSSNTNSLGARVPRRTQQASIASLVSDRSAYPKHAVAVVGMACKFPGADTLDDFWKVLVEGKSMVSTMPAVRFKAGDSYRSSADVKYRGNFIDDIESWDHKFFGKSAREAASTDPQQRHLLQVTYQALQDSGYFCAASKSRDIGAYIGACSTDYDFNVASHPPTAYSTIGTLRAFLSGKISHFFGWTGPSLTFDTACSSSAVAIHTACKALQAGECSEAVAGGATLFSSPYLYENLAAAHFLSPSGATKPFDAAADGYCRGEGIGMVVLKRLDDAIADGDSIRALILGSAVNQNSNCVPITVPHSASQTTLYLKAAREAGIDPKSLDFVEAHGTGTPVGDPIEMESIREAFTSGAGRPSPLYVSSVKGAIGHLEGASGVAALIKAILQLERREIVPQASFTTLNPRIPPLEPHGIRIPRALQRLDGQCLTGCVNNYGAAGSNATLMLMEAPRTVAQCNIFSKCGKYPIILSAASISSLIAYCKTLENFMSTWLASHPSEEQHDLIPSLSYSLARRRDPAHFHTLAFASTPTDIQQLQRNLQKQTSETNSITEHRQRPPVVLCFGGQGADAIALDRRVWEACSMLRDHLDQCHELLLEMGYPGIYPFIFQAEPVTDVIAHNSILFAMQYACARTWIDAGLQVDCLIGHSLGQLTALSVSGTLSLRDGLKFVAGRAALMLRKWGPEPGSMVVLEADEQTTGEVTSKLSELNAHFQFEIACYNGPKCHVVVGDRNSAVALVEEAKRRGVRHKELNLSYGFHSRFTDDLFPELQHLAESLSIGQPSIHVESCTAEVGWREPTSKLIAAHTRDPVHFTQAVQRVRDRLGPCTWLEAGSNSTVVGLAARIVGTSSGKPNKFMPVVLNKPNSMELLADVTADLWRRGHNVQFWPFHHVNPVDFNLLRLPPYIFDKHRHWLALECRKPADLHACKEEEASPPELPATLITLMKSDWQGHHFAINPQSNEFRVTADGHNVLGRQSCPPSIYVDLASRAALLVRRDKQDSILPQVTALQIGISLTCGIKGNIELLLQPAGADWKFTVQSGPESGIVEHASGVVSLQIKSPSMEADFDRFERLASHDHILALLNDPEESLCGAMVYKVMGSLVDYAEHYRGVRSVCTRGSQVAGKIVLPKALASTLHTGSVLNTMFLNYCTQVAGIYANFMRDHAEEQILKLSRIDTVRTGPHYTPLRSDNLAEAVYEVLVYASPKGGDVSNDIFVYDSITKRIVLYILGAVFKATDKPVAGPIHADAPAKLEILRPQQIEIPQRITERPAALSKRAHAVDELSKSTISTPAPRDPASIIHAQLCRTLEELADIEPSLVTGSATFDSLGIDSLMIMEVVSELSRSFSIDLHLDDMMELADMNSLVAYLVSRGCACASDEVYNDLVEHESSPSTTGSGASPGLASSVDTASTHATPVSETSLQDDVKSRLSKIICENLELDCELKGPENLANLGFDSLVAIEIASDIKRHLSFIVDLEDLDESSTFADLVRLVTGDSIACDPTSDHEVQGAKAPSHIQVVDGPHLSTLPPASSRTSASGLFETIRLSFDAQAQTTGFSGFWTDVYPLQSKLVVAYVVEALQQLGCDLKALSPGERLAVVKTEPKHKHLLARMHTILVDAGLIESRNNSFFRTEAGIPQELSATLFAQMLDRHPKHASETRLLNITASKLAECLTGTADPLRLLFADPVNKGVLADVYDSAPMCRAITNLLSDYLFKLLASIPKPAANEPFRLCEVGAGTGATARHIVAFLHAQGIEFEYHFTDISGALVSAAKRKFRDLPGYDKMRFSTLDCNVRCPEDLRGQFHAVIATNCIHATPHASRSAANVKELLRKDEGVFCLVEFTRSLYWFDLVYGLLEGWWLFDDGRTHALAGDEFWNRSLRDAGFGYVSWTDGDTPESQTMRLICACP